MAFIRSKTINGQDYFYLVESYRDSNGKPRQRVLKYMSKFPTFEIMLAGLECDAQSTHLSIEARSAAQADVNFFTRYRDDSLST